MPQPTGHSGRGDRFSDDMLCLGSREGVRLRLASMVMHEDAESVEADDKSDCCDEAFERARGSYWP